MFTLTVEAKILCHCIFKCSLFLSVEEGKDFVIYWKVWGGHGSGRINILKE